MKICQRQTAPLKSRHMEGKLETCTWTLPITQLKQFTGFGQNSGRIRTIFFCPNRVKSELLQLRHGQGPKKEARKKKKPVMPLPWKDRPKTSSGNIVGMWCKVGPAKRIHNKNITNYSVFSVLCVICWVKLELRRSGTCDVVLQLG